METSEIINLCLSGTTIALSIIAVIISILTATKQNRIALFEKRMEVYSVAKKLVLLGEQMRANELSQKNYNVSYFLNSLQYIFSNGKECSISRDDFSQISFCISSVISSANFLFDKKIVEDLDKLHTMLLDIEYNHKDENIMIKISKFSSYTIEFSNKPLHDMEKVIKL